MMNFALRRSVRIYPFTCFYDRALLSLCNLNSRLLSSVAEVPNPSERKPETDGKGKGLQRNEEFKLGFENFNLDSDVKGEGLRRNEEFKLGFEKFKLGSDGKGERDIRDEAATIHTPPLENADEVFKKMKETGLIPNAVAMLDGLCKDGLVQEAMKLFGLMRQKRAIPEVVIYTAVVEGYIKAQRLGDAVRIFRKMQMEKVEPNSFSFTVLIKGLCNGKRLDEAADLCVEMLEAGHSPNIPTITLLVDGLCREKGLEEARRTISTLREKGFSVDERAVKTFLDKNGPFLPLVWEAILGKKASEFCGLL